VQVWNATDGSNAYIYKGHSADFGGDSISSVAWSPDGKRIASSAYYGSTMRIWDASDHYTYLRLQHLGIVGEPILSEAWSSDSKRIASGSVDNTVQVWNAVDGSNVYIYKGLSDAVQSVAWSPDGKSVASGSTDKTVQIWVAS